MAYQPPPKAPVTGCTVFFSEALHQQVKAAASRHDLTMKAFIQRACRAEIARLAAMVES